MASLEEDEDRDLAGSQDGSSDNEMEDAMRGIDDGEGDNEPDADVDGDQDQDQDQDQEPDSPSNASQASDGAGLASQPNQDTTNMTSPGNAENSALESFSIYHPSVRPECLTAKTYDIVPTTAAPHSTSINTITATADMRWVFSGGSDGYVRKFNWADSINSKLMLTVAQRHPFVDSVVKAGVYMTYWENMDGNNISPVYSLACQSEGMWLLAGLESGTIRLQTLRHDEGKDIALLRQHTSAVSSLSLTSDEQSLLSGSWDKRVFDWDLNTGQARRAFGGSAGQISTVQIRPESSLPIPSDTIDFLQTNGTYSSNYEATGTDNFNAMDTTQDAGEAGAPENPQAGSPTDSLFGGADSLFGDADGGAADGNEPSGGVFGVDEDDEFGRALANGVLADAGATDGMDANLPQADSASQMQAAPTDTNANPDGSVVTQDATRDIPPDASEPVVNGLPKAEDLEAQSSGYDISQAVQTEQTPESDTTFLAASMDGTIRVWDRRQPDPVARITPRNVPPWCMNACWSPDGNYIYAGRRNGTVEEYSLHKGLRESERTFKFPQGSGPVTALKAMPNGRHLVCASHDILRLYDLRHEQSSRHSTVPFLIIPGHRTGTISQLYVDNACRYMISTSGNRGWEGNSTEVLLGYEISVPQ
ncbi:Putative Function: SPT8 of S. cerevisiae is a member of the yeast SAGA complex [Penicillium brasilianum]|uniref:Putative Function: SPT8 of S. cerevisiae is a member of the yeast SAGA complex n=1 Tax=Penicillium brasilianum TaxID=104259 RepID=A0A0F7TX40_PENBI|nr:Putative Function: SPT8 of S. cerevisiae is a member of the yeast SAGA complex [Penicillium brasilianum]